MLDSVRLSEHRGTRIRQLSAASGNGGWVNEAICNPSLIFLDEVTSGWTNRRLRNDVICSARWRRRQDVVCVTHRSGTSKRPAIWSPFWAPAECWRSSARRPRRCVFRRSAAGGRLPASQDKSPAAWKEQFRQSSLYERYVQQRLPRDAPRKVLPASRSRSSRSQESLVAVRQLLLLVRRYPRDSVGRQGNAWHDAGPKSAHRLVTDLVFGDISQPSVESEALRVADVAAPGVAWAELLPETQAEFRKERAKPQTRH